MAFNLKQYLSKRSASVLRLPEEVYPQIDEIVTKAAEVRGESMEHDFKEPVLLGRIRFTDFYNNGRSYDLPCYFYPNLHGGGIDPQEKKFMWLGEDMITMGEGLRPVLVHELTHMIDPKTELKGYLNTYGPHQDDLDVNNLPTFEHAMKWQREPSLYYAHPFEFEAGCQQMLEGVRMWIKYFERDPQRQLREIDKLLNECRKEGSPQHLRNIPNTFADSYLWYWAKSDRQDGTHLIRTLKQRLYGVLVGLRQSVTELAERSVVKTK
jgi:hypothetical protein